MVDNDKNKISDSDIIDLILRDKNNFSLLMHRYTEKLLRYIKRITNITDQDREDLLQNIFIKIFINLNGFDSALSLNAWIYRIAHNEVIDFSRKQKRKIEKGHIDMDDNFFSLFSNEVGIIDDYNKKEEINRIEKAFSSMKMKYKEILYLKFIEMYSYRDISDILKKPESNVATMIHRAKKDFKKHYDVL